CDSARADMKHNRKAFACNCVQDFLHQNETLSGRKIRDAATGDGKPFAGTGGAVLGFGLNERQFLTPQVLFAIRDFGLITTTHRRRRCDRVCASALRNMSFYPNDHAGTVRCRWNSWEWRLMFFR